MPDDRELTTARIFRFWSPLAATWLMMSVEGPFLAALIARLDEPVYNLAAYGVAFAFAIIVEAPIIMILSAATALVKGNESFEKLRNFTYLLNLLITLVMGLMLFTPLFDWLTRSLIGLPEPVAELTHSALTLLLPWPAAIGYRRFFQGLLIRVGMTRRVAYGTAIRVVSMATTAALLYAFSGWPGAEVGACALSVAVVLESLGTRVMAIGAVREARAPEAKDADAGPEEPLGYGRILDFYIPLALTSLISLAIHPMVTFFLGQSRMALESLAVFPVVSALAFVFRSMGLSFQEIAIALLNGERENFSKLARFATGLGLASTVGLVVIAFTPLSSVWFERISGLSPELSAFAVLPLQLFSLFPFFSVLLSFQRSILVYGHRTRPITIATFLEVGSVVLLLYVGVQVLDLVGAVAAVIALFLGRLLGNASLIAPCIRAMQSSEGWTRVGEGDGEGETLGARP